MLRLVLIGASLEISVAVGLEMLFRARIIPASYEPIVDYFVFGGIIAAALAGISSLLYLWIRRGLIEGHDT